MDESTRLIYREAFTLKDMGNEWPIIARVLNDYGCLNSRRKPFAQSTLRKEYSTLKKDPEKWLSIMNEGLRSEQAENSDQGEGSERPECYDQEAYSDKGQYSDQSEHSEDKAPGSFQEDNSERAEYSERGACSPQEERSEYGEYSEQGERSEPDQRSDQYEPWEDRMREIAEEVCQTTFQNIRNEMKDLAIVPHVPNVQNDTEVPPEPETITGRKQNRLYGKLSATTDGVLVDLFIAEAKQHKVSTGRLMDIILWGRYGRPVLSYQMPEGPELLGLRKKYGKKRHED
jgi:hypothetical protein